MDFCEASGIGKIRNGDRIGLKVAERYGRGPVFVTIDARLGDIELDGYTTVSDSCYGLIHL